MIQNDRWLARFSEEKDFIETNHRNSSKYYPEEKLMVHFLKRNMKLISETCVCVRGHFEEYFYDENSMLTDTIDMMPGGVVLNIEAGQWHSLRCLESGTILMEAKDGGYRPLDEDEIISLPVK